MHKSTCIGLLHKCTNVVRLRYKSVLSTSWAACKLFILMKLPCSPISTNLRSDAISTGIDSSCSICLRLGLLLERLHKTFATNIVTSCTCSKPSVFASDNTAVTSEAVTSSSLESNANRSNTTQTFVALVWFRTIFRSGFSAPADIICWLIQPQ